MIKWYLITYINENNQLVISIYALKKKEILQYISKYRVIAISKITKRQALEFDRNWLRGCCEQIINLGA